MKFIRSIIAIVLSITLIICSTLPSLAQKNEVQESYVDSKIVEQLKADLGSEKTEKLLSKSLSVENNDFDLVTSDDETFGETNDTQDETTENLNSDMQVELADGVDDESENDSIRLENEEEPEEDMALAEMEYASEEDESLTETEEESEEDASLIEIEGDAVESTNLDKIEDNQTIERSEESAEGEENANNIENAKSTENTDASIIKSHNNLEEGNSKKSSGNVSDENDENSNVGNETTFENEDSVDIQVGGTGNIDNNTSKDSNNETITIDSANETNATLESNNELNDEDDKVATESGVQESISDSNLVATMSDTELKVATDSEALFGVDTPWMWWYLTDEGHTIHYTSTEPASGGNSVIITRYNNIEYTELEKDNIARAVFDNTINAQTCNSFFDGFRNLVEIDNISYLNTNNVTNFQGMFWGCSSLVNLDVSNFNTRNAIDMSSMFRSCISLTSIDLSNFDTRNVTDMSSMFYSCISLTSIDLSNFDTRNVTDMHEMFSLCSSLTIDVSSFNTENVTNMSGMFQTGGIFPMPAGIVYGDLTSIIGLQNFSTLNVTDMSNMFAYCAHIDSLDLSGFDTRKVTKIGSMFYHCSSLTTIYANEKFITTQVLEVDTWRTSEAMFSRCSALVGGNGTVYDSSHTDKEYARVDAAGTPGYFTYREPPAVTLESISIDT
ncbi:MAG: BspA family leucine-rich repeat surface protein, partial [Lachnospiraceae bacterium]|nr:BspA family leucine-rich repeat surface protein [Lachnospiraceae bacterium]